MQRHDRLKLGRVSGGSVTGGILDNRQGNMHGTTEVRAALSFLGRRLPIATHFVERRIFRENRLLLQPEALHAIMLNAVIGRDYPDPSSCIAETDAGRRVSI